HGHLGRVGGRGGSGGIGIGGGSLLLCFLLGLVVLGLLGGCGSGLLSGLGGGLLGGRGLGGRSRAVTDDGERAAHLDVVVLLREDLLDDTGERRGDLRVDLVGRDLEQR